jgi:hypothetical protein
MCICDSIHAAESYHLCNHCLCWVSRLGVLTVCAQEPRNLLGTWTLEMSPNGPMEVLVAFDGRRLAQRLPGDTSGQSTVWLNEQPASPGVILSMPAAPAAGKTILEGQLGN